MGNPVDVHHVIQQNVVQEVSEFFDLVRNGWADESGNKLNLPNDFDVAQATGLPRHASNHAWIDTIQQRLFNEFLDETIVGNQTARTFLESADKGSLAYQQLSQSAQKYADYVRDATRTAILNHEIHLTAIDPDLPPGTTPDQLLTEAETKLESLFKDGQALPDTAARLDQYQRSLVNPQMEAFKTPQQLADFENAVRARGLDPFSGQTGAKKLDFDIRKAQLGVETSYRLKPNGALESYSYPRGSTPPSSVDGWKTSAQIRAEAPPHIQRYLDNRQANIDITAQEYNNRVNYDGEGNLLEKISRGSKIRAGITAGVGTGLVVFDAYETYKSAKEHYDDGDYWGVAGDAGGFLARLRGGLFGAEIGAEMGFSVAGPYGALIGGLAGGIVGASGLDTAAKAVLDAIKSLFRPHDGPDPHPRQKPEPIDPLVLDLDGAGLSAADLTNVQGSIAYFDYLDNGTPTQTGWIGAGQGLLVTAPADGMTIKAQNLIGAQSGNGFLTLATLDSNADGRIDERDPGFSTLRVWVDNGDANSNAGELYALSQLGITSVGVNSAPDYDNFNGNQIIGVANFAIRNSRTGTTETHKIAEVYFAVNTQATHLAVNDTTVLTENAKKLPTLTSFGFLPHLKVSVSLDPVLEAMVHDLVFNSATMTSAQFDAAFETMLFRWAGATDVNPYSRGSYVDARHLAVVYAYNGIDQNNETRYQANPNFHNGPTIWEGTYVQILAGMKLRFVSQIMQSLLDFGVDQEIAYANPYAAFSALNYNPNDNYLYGTVESAFEVANILAPPGETEGSEYWEKIVKRLLDFEFDSLSFESFDLLQYNNREIKEHFLQLGFNAGFDQIGIAALFSALGLYSPSSRLFYKLTFGTGGNDVLQFTSPDEIMAAGAGDDSIYAEEIVPPNYQLANYHEERHIIEWGIGDGNDTIYGGGIAQSTSILKIGSGIAIADMRAQLVEQDGEHRIVLTFVGQSGSITLANQYDTSGFGVIGSIVFADGTTLSGTQLRELAAISSQVTVGDDMISLPADFQGTLNAGDGNDYIKTERLGLPNGTIAGGLGDDTIDVGSSTFLYNLGDGNDTILANRAFGAPSTIRFGPGIAAADLRVAVKPNRSDIVLSIAGQPGSITLAHDYDLGWLDVERIKFDDGTVIYRNELLNMAVGSLATSGSDFIQMPDGANMIDAGAGNDTIYGSSGSETITGGAGDDSIVQSAGSDTYVWNPGDGDDTILVRPTSGGFQKLQFGAGISASDVQVAVVTQLGGYAVELTFTAQPGSIKVVYDGSSIGASGIDYLSFADGSAISWSQLLADQDIVTPGNDVIVLQNGGASIDALAGDDTIYGGSGADSIIGGPGNDTISESPGNDTYNWNSGDGDDVISGGGSGDGFNTIQFGPGISAGDLRVTTPQSTFGNVVLKIQGQPGSITLNGQYALAGGQGIDRVRFEDGTTVSMASILTDAVSMQATSGSDDIFLPGTGGTVDAGAGKDNVLGGIGNDVITGGAGDDTIDAWRGDNTIIWNLGDGNDVVANPGYDTIQFGTDISASDLRVSLVPVTGQPGIFSIMLAVAGQPGSITLDAAYNGYYAFGDNRQLPARLRFADGTSIDSQALADLALATMETPLSDIVHAHGFGGTVDAGAGNDVIYASSERANTIIGGAGNDIIYSGFGSTTYIWNLGDGEDVIHGIGAYRLFGQENIVRFGPNITPSDLRVSFHTAADSGSTGMAMVLTIAGQPGSLTFEGSIGIGKVGGIDRAEFDDGSALTAAQLAALVHPTSGDDGLVLLGASSSVNAGAGNDTIFGGSGNDTITGGSGNDTIHLSPGNDTIVWNLGDGDDILKEMLGSDSAGGIQFGPGILASDFRASIVQSTTGFDIVLTIAGQPGSITFQGGVDWEHWGAFGQVRFDDGTTISQSSLVAMALHSVETSGDDYFKVPEWNLTVDSGAGDDTVYLGDANYTVSGGPGNDTIHDGQGYSTFVWNIGDGDDTLYVGADSGYDIIRYGAGISATDFRVYLTPKAIGYDVVLAIAGQPGSITLPDQFLDHSWEGIAEVRFADGSTIYRYQLDSMIVDAMAAIPTPGDDTIWLPTDGASINAGAGNDTINSSIRNDSTIIGGPGDDHVNLSVPEIDSVTQGSDTIVWNLGDGNDFVHGWKYGSTYVQFGAGISTSDLRVTLVPVETINGRVLREDLVLSIIGQPGSIRFDNAYQALSDQSRGYGIGEIDFADGTFISERALIDLALASAATSRNDSISMPDIGGVLDAGVGNDIITGGFTDDTIIGGKGDDIIYQSNSNDRYIYNLGDGNDTLRSSTTAFYGTSTLQFGVGINVADLRYTTYANGSGMKLVFSGKAGSISIDDELATGSEGAALPSHIEQFRFADGTTLNRAQLLAIVPINLAPVGAVALTNQSVTGNTALDYVLPAGAFTDANSDPLTLTASLADGRALPAWIVFDGQRFSGRAPSNTLAALQVVVTASDGSLSTGSSFTISVDSLNHPPGIASGTTATGAIEELAATTGSASADTASGAILFTDSDSQDLHSAAISGVSVSAASSGLPSTSVLLDWLTKGSLTEPGGQISGSLAWNFAAPDSAFDYLGAGELATLTYAVEIADGNGGIATQDVVVTITGGNDAPVIALGTTAAGSVSEIANVTDSSATDAVSGAIRFTDADASDVHAATVTGVGASGVVSGLPASSTLLAMLSLGVPTEQNCANAGSLPWSFSAADNSFDYLAAGEVATLTYAVRIDDGHGVALLQDVTITITGNNDVPAIAAGTIETGAVAEIANATSSAANDAVSGLLRFTDADASDGHAAMIASVSASGVTGGLPANAALKAMLSLGALTEQWSATPGSVAWTFAAPDSSFDYLGAGEVATLTYSVQLDDGHGGIATQDVVVTVTGSDDIPAIAAGTSLTGALAELANVTGSTLRDTASGLIRFTDADASDLHSAAITGVAASGNLSGLPGTSTLQTMLMLGTITEPSGTGTGSLAWAFAAADSTFDYLAAGETATLVYTVQLDDGKGGSLAQDVAITIAGSNDLPLISSTATSATVSFATQTTPGVTAPDTATGTIAYTDADGSDTHSANKMGVSATGAVIGLPDNATLLSMLTLGGLAEQAGGAPGTVAWNFSAADAQFNYLAAGESVTLNYAVQIADNRGGVATQVVAITVSGTNYGPTIATGTSASGAFAERAGLSSSGLTDSVSGTLRFNDLNLSDTHSVSIAGVATSGSTSGLPAAGSLFAWLGFGAVAEGTTATPGSVGWTFAAPDSSFDYLAAGETATVTYSVQIADNSGATVTQDLTIVISGSNDAPTVDVPGAQIARAGLATALNGVAVNDLDNSAIETVTISDLVGNLAATAASGAIVTGSGTKTLTISGALAAVNATLNSLTYTAAAAGTDTITVTAGDGTATSTATIAQTINTTTNSVPVLATGGILTGSVNELSATTGSMTRDLASGNVRFTDANATDTHVLTVLSVAASGTTTGLPANATLKSWLTRGMIAEPANGVSGSAAWNFSAPDKSFDFLQNGQSVVLTFTVRLADNHGGSVNQTVTITVNGSNDAPTIATGTVSTGKITELANTLAGPTVDAAAGTIKFADADKGDNHTAVIVGVTATGIVGGLPSNATLLSWLNLGALTEPAGTTAGSFAWNFAAADSSFDYLTAGQIATLTYAVRVADAFGASVTRNVVITIVGTNDAPSYISSGSVLTGAFSEQPGLTASLTSDTATGALRFTDPDLADTHTLKISSVTASGITGGLPASSTILSWLKSGGVAEPSSSAPGTAAWNFAASDRSFDYLAEGQILTLTYLVTLADNHAGSMTRSVVITVTGTNDLPKIATGTTASATIPPRAAIPGLTTAVAASGTIRFTDADLADTHGAVISSISAVGTVTGLPNAATMLGWLSLGALTEQTGATAGSLGWNFSAADNMFNYLSVGQSVTLNYTVQIADNRGGSLSQVVSVKVNGVNYKPVAVNQSGFTTDNWTPLPIDAATLLAGASDANTADVLRIASVSGAVGGAVSLVGGNAVFTPTATAIGPASFNYTVSDGHAGTSVATVSIVTTLHTITGAAGSTIQGGAKTALLDGSTGNMTVKAGTAGDTLLGGAGDTLFGGAGADLFAFQSGFGMETINNFTATGLKHDTLQFDHSLFSDWAHLLGATRQVGTDLVIGYDAANEITLKNVAMANFTSANATFM